MTRLSLALAGLLACASGASAQVLYGPAAITGGTIKGATITNSDVSGSTVTATGTTTSRTPAARAAEVINAYDKGLICDGVTDNATVLAAIRTQALLKSGQTVYFPPAALPCMTSNRLIGSSHTTYFAYPGSVVLKATSASASSPVLFEASGGVTDIFVYGLTFDGNQANNTANANNVVAIFNVANVVFDHIAVQNTRGIGINFSTSIRNSGVRNSSIINVGLKQSAAFTGSATGTTLTVASSPAPTGTIAVGNSIYQPGGSANNWTTITGLGTGTGGAGTYTISTSQTLPNAAMFAYNSDTTSTANVSQGIATCCGAVSANVDNFFDDNFFSNIGLDPLSLGTQTRVRARGNRISPGGQHGGIYATGNVGLDITGNQVYGAAGNGIDIYLNTDVHIADNHSNLNGAAGIQFASTTVGHIVGNTTNNNFRQNPVGSLHQGGLTLGGNGGDPASSLITISGNTATDYQTTPTQNYGFLVQSGAAATLTGLKLSGDNQFQGNILAAVSGVTLTTATGCTTTAVVGTTAGTFTSGTTGACTVVLTIGGTMMAPATTAWQCHFSNQTTANLFRQTAADATTSTGSGTTVSGDVISYACVPS